MKDLITEGLYRLDEEEDLADPIISDISDLQESGYLTQDEGLVVLLTDQRKFIITIQEV